MANIIFNIYKSIIKDSAAICYNLVRTAILLEIIKINCNKRLCSKYVLGISVLLSTRIYLNGIFDIRSGKELFWECALSIHSA
jgi:hypothetical protein